MLQYQEMSVGLRSFLGLLNYFMENSFLTSPRSYRHYIYTLLKKDTKFVWGHEQSDAFSKAKELLTSTQLLIHFDPDKEIIVTSDASPYGIGAVLSHRLEDGSEKPIYYASRSLAQAEKGYSQLDKEALAIIFAVKKFHNFIYGRSFTIHSDHRPLQHIFGHTKPVPTLASARLQRWALMLGAYDYRILYRPGREIRNADGLSRLPLSEAPSEVPVPGETVLLMERLELSSVNARKIAQWTGSDPILARVYQYVLQGWPQLVEHSFVAYQRRGDELSAHVGCVLWGSRVVVPKKGQELVTDLLHEGHPGISRMKSLARSFVWWPGMDIQLENRVKDCERCQSTRHLPPKVPLHPWEWPKRPWERIHIDHAGPFLGKQFLLVVDAHSKWLEIEIVNSTTSSSTIEKLRSMFATHGLPESIVSDNGTAFTSEEFREFMERNSIRHIRTAPYHPSSNGQVERAVQSFKEGMMRNLSGSLETRLSRFLFHYRSTPHSTTGISPAELLMGRHLRTQLSLIRPNLAVHVAARQKHQKEHYDKNTAQRVLEIGDSVFVRNFLRGPPWLPGTLESYSGPRSFVINLEDGRSVRRHCDHIRIRGHEQSDSKEGFQRDDEDGPVSPLLQEDDGDQNDPITPRLQEDLSAGSNAEDYSLQDLPVRRSTRIRKPPDRYDPAD